MGVAIGSNILDGRHRYKPVATKVMVSRKNVRLAKDNFRAFEKKPSLKLDGISTRQKKPFYFSPTALGIGCPAADPALVRHCSAVNSTECLGSLDMGCMANAKHCFVFRGPMPGGGGIDQWYIGINNFSSSCAVALPVSLEAVPGHDNAKYIVFTKELVRPTTLVVSSWKDIHAIPTQWRAWGWQVQNLPNAMAEWSSGVRLCVEGEETTLLQLATKQAFWALSLSELQRVAKVHKMGCDPKSNLYDQTFEMVRTALECSEMDVLDIVGQRLSSMQTDTSAS